jgi:hypothetical protein
MPTPCSAAGDAARSCSKLKNNWEERRRRRGDGERGGEVLGSRRVLNLREEAIVRFVEQ